MPVSSMLFALALDAATTGARPPPAAVRSADWELLEFLGGSEADIESELLSMPAGAPPEPLAPADTARPVGEMP